MRINPQVYDKVREKFVNTLFNKIQKEMGKQTSQEIIDLVWMQVMRKTNDSMAHVSSIISNVLYDHYVPQNHEI